MASTIGTVIEWYDFLIYGMAAALVFNKLFFPTGDPLMGTLAALATYAVGFVARPVGGALFGHCGDRYGRKKMLVVSLLLMGGATVGIGLLPTYAQVGVWAPVALVCLRLLQGLGLGGEWGGAALLVYEHAPRNRRGLFGSLVQIGFPLGLVLATLSFSMLGRLSQAELLDWGWRLPFLASAVLVILGSLIRSTVQESPAFLHARASSALVAAPVREVLTRNRRTCMIAVGLKISEVAWVYILTVFLVVYLTAQQGLPKQVILDAVLYGAILELATIPLVGMLSDRFGSNVLYLFGAVFTLCFAFPLFWLLESSSALVIALTIGFAMTMGHATMFAPQATYFPQLFSTGVRYSGASLGFQVAAAIGGGLTPLAATALASYMGGTSGVSLILMGLASITLWAALAARQPQAEQ